MDNREVILPNGALSNGNINNISRNPLRRVDWTFNVEYGSDVQECNDVFLSLLKADGRVLDASVEGAADPFIAISQLTDSHVTFTVRAWVKSPDYWGVFFDLNKNVYVELPKHGIKFPFQQVDVHIHQ